MRHRWSRAALAAVLLLAAGLAVPAASAFVGSYYDRVMGAVLPVVEPIEDAVDETTIRVSSEGAAVIRDVGQGLGAQVGRGLLGAQDAVGFVPLVAAGATQDLTEAVGYATGVADSGAALGRAAGDLAAARGGDLGRQAIGGATKSMAEARAYEARRTEGAQELQADLLSPLPQVFRETADSVPRPDGLPVVSFLATTEYVIEQVTVNHPSPEELAALALAMGEGAAALPGAVTPTVGGYLAASARNAGGHAEDAAEDTVATGSAVAGHLVPL